MHITYEGGVRGLAALTDALRAEGVKATYTPPGEQRHVGEEVHRVVIYVVEQSRDHAADFLIGIAVQRAIAKVRARFPGLRAEITETPEDED